MHVGFIEESCSVLGFGFGIQPSHLVLQSIHISTCTTSSRASRQKSPLPTSLKSSRPTLEPRSPPSKTGNSSYPLPSNCINREPHLSSEGNINSSTSNKPSPSSTSLLPRSTASTTILAYLMFTTRSSLTSRTQPRTSLPQKKHSLRGTCLSWRTTPSMLQPGHWRISIANIKCDDA